MELGLTWQRYEVSMVSEHWLSQAVGIYRKDASIGRIELR
jgi:hypothetical protein